MKHLFTLALLLPLCSLVHAQIRRIQPTCTLNPDGRAVGYINNLRDEVTVDGYVWFHFFDCNGNFISSEREWEYEYVSEGSREEIEYTTTPSGACSCEFHPEGAIRPLPKPPTDQTSCHPKPYLTSCKVVNGYGRGYLTALNRDITVDGKVWFYFYDCNGIFLGSEDESEYEFVNEEDREEIEYTEAPMNACKCVFDVTGGIVQ